MEAIRSGTILIREGISLPENLRFESVAWMPGWRVVKQLLGFSMGQKVKQAGWTFFSVGNAIKASALGKGEGTVHRALRGILDGLKANRFNAVEITAVYSDHFLGVPFTSVTVHSRHIEESISDFCNPRK